MIHKARVLVTFPGALWAQKKQAQRSRENYDPKNMKFVRFEGRNVEKSIVFCEKGSIKVQSSSGGEIDSSSELEYEFVKYDERSRLIILAVMNSESKAGKRLDAVFGAMNPDEVFQGDRVFLIIPVKMSGGQVVAMALMPTGNDAHNTYGICASPDYLTQLLRVSGR